MKISIHLVIPNPEQPRTIFDQAELEGLAQSIRENDLIQPIVVEKAGDHYILIDGERRWRACQLAGLSEIEAVVRPSSNHNGVERLTKALVANIQRSAMGPVDEARAFEKLIKEFGSVESVAQKVGVHSVTIYTKLSLLDFPEPVQKIYNLRRLSVDTSTIAALKRLNSEQQLRIVTKAASRGWSAKTMLHLITLEQKNGGGIYIPPKRTKKEIKFEGHFDALALINGKKLPREIREAAVKTCQACSLYPEASPAICKECPLPDFLRRLEVGRKGA
jgi:ParB family chromosome partitioning protein